MLFSYPGGSSNAEEEEVVTVSGKIFSLELVTVSASTEQDEPLTHPPLV